MVSVMQGLFRITICKLLAIRVLQSYRRVYRDYNKVVLRFHLLPSDRPMVY